jgi:hypothetical protein
LPEEVNERVEPLAPGMTAAKPASQRREDDPILGIGIDVAMNPGDVQEPHGRASHGAQS